VMSDPSLYEIVTQERVTAPASVAVPALMS
jgi:hypothetical protein